MEFFLHDNCSLNLNYLIYINNLYKSKFSSDSRCFPWLPLEKSFFLDDETFTERIKNLWNEVLNRIETIPIDIDSWNSDRFNYKSLFNINNENYNIIKRTYNQWYSGCWQLICSLYSRNIIKWYYERLTETAKKAHIKLIDVEYCIQFVYDVIPNGWAKNAKNTLVICPETQRLKSKDIFEYLYGVLSSIDSK